MASRASGASSTARYHEYPPPPDLAALVVCFWTMQSDQPIAGSRLHRVLPDGGSDIIFDFGDVPVATSARPLTSYVVGTMLRPIVVRLRRRVDLFGVRFLPGGAKPFVAVHAAALTDRLAPLAELWRGDAGDVETVLRETAAHDRPARFAQLLRAQLRTTVQAPDSRVAHVARMIARSRGSASVRSLHEAIGITRRHLERLYLDHVGISPKTACRVARFRWAVAALRRGPVTSLSTLAHAAGYADHPHFVREFRALGGRTPRAFQRERDPVAFVQDGVNGGW